MRLLTALEQGSAQVAVVEDLELLETEESTIRKVGQIQKSQEVARVLQQAVRKQGPSTAQEVLAHHRLSSRHSTKHKHCQWQGKTLPFH